ncbi:MAG TPA: LysR family transcriptional regulator [Pseudomonadales bacterium]
MTAHRLHQHIGSVRQLEILLTVYEQGSITGAARLLHLTQPSVSMQLAKLADTVGLPLYYTHGKQLRFTEAGTLLVQTARDIFKCYEYAGLALDGLKGLEQGSLQLSVVTTAKYFIPHLIGDFCQQHPQVSMRFHVGNRQQIIERTRADEDDFYVFSHPPDNPDLELTEFLRNPLVAIAPQDHPLAGKKNISLKTLLNYPLLMREQGSGTRYTIERFFARHKLQPDIRMTIESNEAIRHSVMAGLGIAILSEHTLRFGGQAGLVVLDIRELPIVSHWYLVRRKSRPLSPLAQRFMEFSRNLAETSLLAGLP